MRRGLAVALAVGVLALAGCGDDGSASGDPTSSSAVPRPGDPDPDNPVWDPAVPETPVDPIAITEQYAATLDAAVAATGDGQTFTAATTTEVVDDLCVVQVERTAGPVSTAPDDVEAALTGAVSGLGFDDVTFASDPGGAVLLIAHDAADALLEWRSKTDTTIAVRVATAPTVC